MFFPATEYLHPSLLVPCGSRDCPRSSHRLIFPVYGLFAPCAEYLHPLPFASMICLRYFVNVALSTLPFSMSISHI